MSDPSVSPADTIRHEKFPNATPRPWYFDGWDIFTSATSAGPRGDGHRMVIPLKTLNDNVFHPSQRVSDDDARLIVQAVNERDELLAVGERDRAEIERLRDGIACALNELETATVGNVSPIAVAKRVLRAVLADKEDAE